MKRTQKLADLFKEKEVKTMITKKKPVSLIGKMAAVTVLFLLMLFASSKTVYAYELYIGNTQVTDTNKGNIFGTSLDADGNPTAWYEPDTATLHLNGVHIDADYYHEGQYRDAYREYYDETYPFSLYSDIDVVKHLVITGDNSFVSKASAEGRNGGICFIVSGTRAMSYTQSDPDKGWDKSSLIITGSGTLTSTSTDGNKGTAMTVIGVQAEDNGMYVSNGIGGVIMGETDGTGPTLKLTGWETGADFCETGRVVMQGGTIIAEATSTGTCTGVKLPDEYSCVYFEGGTIAGKGTYNDSEYEGGAFNNDGYFDIGKGPEHGMQRVYPIPAESEKEDIKGISGWCVVGMTADGFKGKTDAVLVELGLAEKTEPVPGVDNHYHTDTLPDPGVYIDVEGFTKAGIVYSVDVEWGAMTFQYEKTTWNAEMHKTEPGRGWLVYDNVTEKVINSTQDTINHITVTNHSNADVFATLSYTGSDGYTDITGGFTTKEGDVDTRFTAATDTNSAYLTLGTADNNGGETEGQGKETVGTVYFMPSGIGKTGDVVNEISKWTKIGKITVGILTETPQ